MLAVYFILYFVLAGGLVFLSDKLGKYIDLLDKKTKVSGAFLGGVLLAAVTSLPELFTSISATLFVGEKELVVGNVLGSNLFNVLVLGACFMIFFKGFRKSKIDYKSHFFTFFGLAVIYALICYGIFVPTLFQPVVGPINFICPLALVAYGIIIFLQPKEEEKEDEEAEKEDTCPLTVKQILIRFVICAVTLVGISIAITYVTDLLAEELQLGTTFAGALFLAVATSLPELVSCVTLCRKGNYNAAVGDIVGSCFFNFCIIGISEFLSYDGSLLTQVIYDGTPISQQLAVYDAVKMTILAIIVLIVIFALLLIKKLTVDKKSQEEKSTWFNVITIIFGAIAFSGYIIYLLI